MDPLKIYDANYAERYRKQAVTELGRKIYESRWKMIEKYCHGNMRLLDYGCASGAFHMSSPNGFRVHGYDLNPNYGFSEMPSDYINILTMWDVIEHLHEPWQLVKELHPQWIFLSTPNLESVKGPVKEWKHYRPYEHVAYFDKHSLRFHLEAAGYEIMEFNFEEGALRDPSNPEAVITCVARLR